MPSVTPKQARTMQMVKNDPEKAKAVGIDIPESVAEDFVAADEQKAKRKKQAQGLAAAMSKGKK